MKKLAVLLLASVFIVSVITCSKDNIIIPGDQEFENQDSENQESSEIDEPVNNYKEGPDALSWGNLITPTTLGLTPGDDTTQVNLNWYSSGTLTGRVAKVRFIRGTIAAGTELLETTGTVSSAGSSYAHKVTVKELKPGSKYQYAVSNNGTDWSKEYDFKVPAAGAFKFAVVADPQLNANVDSKSRYTPSPSTPTQSWTETIQKVVDAGASFIASCGDQVDTNSNETQYSNFFEPEGFRNLPLAPAMGNHDPHDMFFYHFNIPNEQGTANNISLGANYYYRYNNILFVVLNTGICYYTSSSPITSATAAGPYVTRFRTTIQAAKAAHAGKYDWLIVQHHRSTASVGTHCADTDLQYFVEAGFEKLMSDEKVDFVIAGHDHVYARSYPLQGKDSGNFSVPDKTKGGNEVTNPGNPIYMTFNTASVSKYYLVSADKTYPFSGTVTNNTKYPYLGTKTDGTPLLGSDEYKKGNLPVSNLTYSQALIPSYTIVSVNGRTITFKTYPIATANGTSLGASAPYSYNANTPYDWVTVTKN